MGWPERQMDTPHAGGRRPRLQGCSRRRGVGRVAWWVVICLMGPAPALAGTGAHAHAEEVAAVDFMKHGNPAPVAAVRGAAAAELPDGRSVVLAWLSGQRDYSLLVVDVDSGETEQFHHEGRARGRAFLLTEAGQFYAYGDSKLLVYDVHENELSIIEGRSRFGYAMAEGRDGTVYIAGADGIHAALLATPGTVAIAGFRTELEGTTQ